MKIKENDITRANSLPTQFISSGSSGSEAGEDALDAQSEEALEVEILARNMISAAKMVMEKNESLIPRADVVALEASIFKVEQAIVKEGENKVQSRTNELKILIRELISVISEKVRLQNQLLYQDIPVKA